MISSLVDGIFAVVLLTACWRLVSVHHALAQLRALHQNHQVAFEKTAAALGAVRAALSETGTRCDELSTALAALIDAREAIGETDARMSAPDRPRFTAVEQPAASSREDENKRPAVALPRAAASNSPFDFCRRVSLPMVEALAKG